MTTTAQDDAEFRRQVVEQSLVCERAEKAYLTAKDVSLARKKALDEQRAKLASIIADFGKVDPQKKLPFPEDDATPVSDGIQLGEDPAPEPPVAATPVVESVSDSPSIETLDLPSKVIQSLAGAGVGTVAAFLELVECKLPAYPNGPEDIDGLGKKAIKQIAAVYEEVKIGDAPSYDPPLPKEPVAGVPVPVPVPEKQTFNQGGEVLSTSLTTGESEVVDSIDEEPEPVASEEQKAEVKIRALIEIEGAIVKGLEYVAEMIDNEAVIKIEGEPLVLTEGEFERVAG